jgi:two-component system CheB/CheR fusion protein
VKTASAAFYQTFGVTPDKTEGRLIYDLGNGQWNIPALRTLLEDLLPEDGHIDDFEVRHTFPRIGPRIMLLNARRLGSDAECELLIVLAIEDITGRRAHEAAMVAHATDLVRADRSKDEFLAMLAHELRNPLAPLRNAAEILRTTGADDENMTRMIDDLLDVSRITEGKVELRKEMVSLEAALRVAESLARPEMEALGQELTVTLPAEAIYLYADVTRLDQILGNLLGNACKYSGSACKIELSAERALDPVTAGPQVLIRIRDHGIGIDPEVLPHVFGLFVQANRASDRAHGGLGIGLTLVQRLVNLHGGSVEARSEGLGHGSEFVVRLPILPGPAAPPAPAPVVPDHEPSVRMLIVDDNVDAAQTMSMLQELRGHRTRCAHNGLDALVIASEFLPQVVLLDIGLPGMDGLEVARRLRAMPELDGVLLVAMTGYGSDDDRKRAMAAGFDRYLVKPVNLGLLRQWLQALP